MKTLSAFVVALSLVIAAPLLADPKVDQAVAKAEDQYKKGRPDEAIKGLEKLVGQMPNSVDAHVALARFYDRTGEVDKAKAELDKAVAVATDPASKSLAYAAQSALAMSSGSSKAAVAAAQQAVAAQDTPVAQAALARALARAGSGQAALDAANKAVAAGANLAVAYEALGAAYLAAGKSAESDAAFRKALALDANLQRARVGLAQALLAEGKPAEAVKEAKAATDADPKLAEGFAVYGLALLAENDKNWNGAIEQAQQGAFLGPKNATVHMAVAKIFYAAGNVDQAKASAERALQVDPTNVPARRLLIETLTRKGDLDGALAQARQLAADFPESGDAQMALGTILLRKQDFAGAAAPLELAAKSTGTAEAWAYLGTAYANMAGKLTEAQAAYQKAVTGAPTNIDYRTTYGLLLAMGGKQAEGIAELQKVTTSPGYKDTDGFINLGYALRTAKRFDESVTAYKKALELDPKNAQAMIGLGWSQLPMKAYDDAIATFNKANELDAKGVGCGAYAGIGWAHLFKKDVPKAEEFLAKAQACGRKEAKLKENIDRVKKGQEAEEAADEEPAPRPRIAEPTDAGSCSATLLSGAPAAAKLKAITCLQNSGEAGVPALIRGLRDGDRSVRAASARALGNMGCVAKQAKVYLQQAYEYAIELPAFPSKEDLDRVAKDKVVADACSEALRKLQGCK